MSEKGMPMLDYICLRKKAKINALLDRDEFHGKQVFLDAYEKWQKIFKHQRKKEFKFSHLIKFMQNNQVDEEEKTKAQAKELLVTVRTLLQQKIEKLLTTRVEKLVQTVQSQDSKITKITEVLKLVYDIQEPKPNRIDGVVSVKRRMTTDFSLVGRKESSMMGEGIVESRFG